MILNSNFSFLLSFLSGIRGQFSIIGLEVRTGRIFQARPGPCGNNLGLARPETKIKVSARARPSPKEKLKFRPEPSPACERLKFRPEPTPKQNIKFWPGPTSFFFFPDFGPDHICLNNFNFVAWWFIFLQFIKTVNLVLTAFCYIS